jgi:asparagine synthetase B (glutamine-hydrolysing)
MCGISAVVSLSPRPLDAGVAGGAPKSYTNGSNGSNGSTTSKLEQSLETIKHRGPDARSTWTSSDGRVGIFCILISQLVAPQALADSEMQHWVTSVSPSTT